MRRSAFFVFSAVCAVVSAVFYFALIGYKFSAYVLFALALFSAFLGISNNIEKKPLKIIRNVLITVFVLCVAAGTILTCMVLSGLSGDNAENCDYLIVLGAGINGDKPSLTLYERLVKTEELMSEFPNCKAIVSGAKAPDEDFSEAEVMKRFLVSRGIDEARITEEKRAKNTRENIRFSLDIINSVRDSGDCDIVIVSSDYHIFRARYIARKLGLEPAMASAETSLPVLRINYILREAAALVKTYWEMLS